MLKAAIEKIVSLAEVKTFDIEGHTYATEGLTRIDAPIDRPRSIMVSGLDSICKLIRTEMAKVDATIIVSVEGPGHVSVLTTYLNDFSRNYLYEAKADAKGIREGYRDRDVALIELRSLFIPNEGTDYLLTLLSKVSNDSKVSSSDNGVTQTVEAISGVALKENVPVRPRVALKPFRTFLEVPQPESEFLIRVDDEMRVSFTEADGGIWKLEAKSNISAYFEKSLADLIANGKVVVMI